MALKAGYKGIKKNVADGLNSLNSATELATDKEVEDAVGTVEMKHSNTVTIAAGERAQYVIPAKDGYRIEHVTPWVAGIGIASNSVVSLIGDNNGVLRVVVDNKDEESHDWTIYVYVTYKKVSS